MKNVPLVFNTDIPPLPPPLVGCGIFFVYFNKFSFCYVFHFLTKHINIAQTQLHTDSNNNNNNNNNNNKRKETNPSTFSSIYTKKNNKWSKRRKDRLLIRFIFAPFLVWISNIFFDLAIIVSNKKIVLILELRTLMEGEYLFCLQEYRYCFTSKNTMVPKYLVLTSNTKQYVFVWRFSILTLRSTSHFMTSAQKFLVLWQDRKRCSRNSYDSPHEEHAEDGMWDVDDMARPA